MTLLSKLDRRKKGEFTACTIIKSDTIHKMYPQTMESIAVVAYEDGGESPEYYWSADKVLIPRSKLLSLLEMLEEKKKNTKLLCRVVVDHIGVRVVEDIEYYAERNAGDVHPSDEPKK